MNGETRTGVTTFFIDDKIDTGAVILQEEAPIFENDNAQDLHDRLMVLGAALVLKTAECIHKGDVKTTIQKDTTDLKLAHKLHRETCEINWERPGNEIYNFIRGLSPYPSAWSTLYNGNEKMLTKIFTTELQLMHHELKPGRLLFNKKELKVVVKNGYLNLLEIQLQGKKRMAVKDVLNGLQLEENAYLGNVEGSLKKGNRVSLVGFGSWSVSRRNAREGRNPSTGKTIQIAAKNVVKFKAGADLGSAVN